MDEKQRLMVFLVAILVYFLFNEIGSFAPKGIMNYIDNSEILPYSIIDSNCACNGYSCEAYEDFDIGGVDLSNAFYTDNEPIFLYGFSIGSGCMNWPRLNSCPDLEDSEISCGEGSECIASGSPVAPYCVTPTGRVQGGWLRIKPDSSESFSSIIINSGYAGISQHLGLNIDVLLENGSWIPLDSLEFISSSMNDYLIPMHLDMPVSEIHISFWSWQVASGAIIDSIALVK